MYVSSETPEESRVRLFRVLATAEVVFYQGTFAFEEFPHVELRQRLRNDALAVVRDDEVWSQLIASSDTTRELFSLFSFHFAEGLDNSGFVGWLASELKRKLGTGVFVICGQNSKRGGIFDYWGCPARLGSLARDFICRLRLASSVRGGESEEFSTGSTRRT